MSRIMASWQLISEPNNLFTGKGKLEILIYGFYGCRQDMTFE